MEIGKTQSENIVQTKDLELVKNNYIKSDNCDKMVANTQDNVSTASEMVAEDQQQQQQKSISKSDSDIPKKDIEKNDLPEIENKKTILKVIEETIESPSYEISEEITKKLSTREPSETTSQILNETNDNENLILSSVKIKPIETDTTDKLTVLSSVKLNNDEITNEQLKLTECDDEQDEFDDDEDTLKHITNSTDAEDDEDDEEEADDVEDDDSDEVMILDSSDEEKERKAVNEIEHSYEDYDDDVEDSIDSDNDSDDYDDNDLMDDVVMSVKRNKIHNIAASSKAIIGNKISNLIKQRKRIKRNITQLSFRCQAKKRSVKCLNSKIIMHNVEELHHQNIKLPNDDDHELMAIDDNDYHFSTESLTNSETGLSLNASNTSLNTSSMKLSRENLIDLDSSTENQKNNSKTIDIKVTSKNQSELPEIITSSEVNIKNNIEIDDFEDINEIKLNEKMQPVDKIRETIQKSENINELPIKSVGVVIIDEQNKENLNHNDKIQNILEETSNKSISQVTPICNGEKIKIDLDDKLTMKIEKDLNVSEKIEESTIGLDNTVTSPIELNENIDINNKIDSKSEKVNENNLVEPNNETIKENRIEKSNLLDGEFEILKKQSDQKNEIVPHDSKDNNTSQTVQLTRKRPHASSIEDDEKNLIHAIATSTPVQSSDLSSKIQYKLEKPPIASILSQQLKQQLQNETENDDIVHPTKKLRAELETNFRTHDRILSEYIERTSNDSPNNIDKHIGQLAIEIQTLNDMIKAKEIEWNNMLHLKKVKEEICFRLTRKKQVMELMAIKVGELPNSQQQQQQLNLIDSGSGDAAGISMKSDLSGGNQNTMLKIPNISGNSSALAAMAAAASSSLYNLSGNNTITSSGSTTHSILQNRANMKSSDLAKEKANTQKLHRLLVSRNILPKPGSSSLAGTSSTTTTTSSSTIVNAQQIGLGGLLGSASSPILLGNSQNNNIQQQLQQFPLSLSNIATGSLLNHINNNNINNNNNNGLLHQQQPILNSYLTAAASVQQQLGELFNGHHQTQQQQQQNAQNLMIGRQGVFKDVKSIIADYRQRHPEQVPRRGRRMKSTNSNDITSGGQRGNGTDLSSLFNRFEGNSRPSSNDSSSHSMTNIMPSSGGNINSNNSANVSFKDALLQIAKISGQNADRLSAAVAASSIGKSSGGGGTQPSQQQHGSFGSPYPEVTLHPVSTTNVKNESTGSLLHGILTKYTRPNPSSPTATVVAPGNNPTSSNASLLVHQLNQQHTTCTPTSTTNNYNSTFSPTLARLLTAPERMANSGIQNNTNNNNNNNNSQGSHAAQIPGGSSPANNSYPNISGGSSGGLNLSKVVGHNSEITITPVVNSALNLHQSILQQQIQKQHQQQQQIKDVLSRNVIGLAADKIKGENIMNMDDEADDSVDRLVIDEGGDSSIGAEEQYRIAPRAIGQEFNENEVPACQGCKKQEAQFVCAGCGNQWYCSRECQVQAWDEHSEVCTG